MIDEYEDMDYGYERHDLYNQEDIKNYVGMLQEHNQGSGRRSRASGLVQNSREGCQSHAVSYCTAMIWIRTRF